MQGRWRNPRTLQAIGIVGTVLWLTHVGLTTGFDPAHPLFNFIFIVPLVGWVIIAFVIRYLERSDKD